MQAVLHSPPRAGAYAPDDYDSCLALAQPVRQLGDGAADGSDLAVAVHANFARVIEQNFAAASPEQASRWLDTVETRSLATLAQAYLNATEHRGRAAVALHILAQRLDATRLARLAAHFGFLRTQAAVQKAAPGKLGAFCLQADARRPGPVPGEMNLHRHEPALAGQQGRMGGYGVFLDYSTEEVYLCLRTAPTGATGALVAMFETCLVIGATLPGARHSGARIGACLSLGWQVCGAAIWEPLVPGVAAWMQALTQAGGVPPEARLAQWQREGGVDVFGLPAALQVAFASGGGDYQCAQAWADSGCGTAARISPC